MRESSIDNLIIVENRTELEREILRLYPNITLSDEILDYIITYDGVGVEIQSDTSKNFPFISGSKAAGKGGYLIFKKSIVCLLIEMLCFGIGAWAQSHDMEFIYSGSIVSAITAFAATQPKWYVSITNDSRCVFLHIWRTCKKTSFSRQEIEKAYKSTECKNQISDWDCLPRSGNICKVPQSDEHDRFVYNALSSLEGSGILRYSDNLYHFNAGIYTGKDS
jgi:hypothetical protein